LWGIGVTSRSSVTLNPAACSARNALSRPAPGPFTNTVTDFIPCSWALRAALSAASCDAKGVLFLEPLNPIVPELAQATVFPCRSVIVMWVLLNVAWMWAIPVGTFFFTFRLMPFFFALAIDVTSPFYRVFLRFMMPRLGPLRVRAFVWVRWPRTGRPRRCLSPR